MMYSVRCRGMIVNKLRAALVDISPKTSVTLVSVKISVSDPYHFDLDPDPRIRIDP